MREKAPHSLPPSSLTLRATPAIFVDASGTLLGGSPITGGIVPYPDAYRLIQGFRARDCGGRRIKTGLITNWGRRVHHTLSVLELSAAFDVVVCADDVPAGKPHPGMFEHAAALLGLSPDECLHVGDSLWDDALGAQEAGWQGVWLVREGKAGAREREYYSRLAARPPIVTSLDELWNSLESL